MIYTISSRNENGVSLTLDLQKPEEYGVYVTSVDGLGPPDASMTLTTRPYADGSLFTGNTIPERTITISLALDPHGATVEQTRDVLLRAYPVKARLQLAITTEKRTYLTDGYVEKFNPEIFSERQTIDITIRCPDPYLYNASLIDDPIVPLGSEIPLFEFPFGSDDTPSIEFSKKELQSQVFHYYDGQTSVGLEITIEVRSDLVEPVHIANSTHNEVVSFFKAYGSLGTLKLGDVISIDTTVGNRKATLLRDGTYYNALAFLNSRNTAWPLMHPGENQIVQRGATVTMARTSFRAKTKYLGV